MTIILILLGGYGYTSSTVVFDNSCDFFGLEEESSVGLSILKEELEFKDYKVTDNVRMKLNADSVTDSLLRRANILVLINPGRSFSYEERKMISDWVEKGGKLFLISDNPDSAPNINSLARGFGAEFIGTYYLGEGSTVSLTEEISGSEQNAVPYANKGKLPKSSYSNQIILFSPIPLELHEEPKILLVSPKIEAKDWTTQWEKPEETLAKDSFTIFAGLSYHEGKVAFLGDKDILLNENIRKKGNLQFVSSIFDWLTGEEKTAMIKDQIVYTPERLTFRLGRKHLIEMLVENKGEVDQILHFITPPYLNLEFNPTNLYLPVDSKGLVRVTMTNAEYLMSAFIIVEREYESYLRRDYIPTEVTEYKYE
jgi:hypothetical protein